MEINVTRRRRLLKLSALFFTTTHLASCGNSGSTEEAVATQAPSPTGSQPPSSPPPSSPPPPTSAPPAPTPPSPSPPTAAPTPAPVPAPPAAPVPPPPALSEAAMPPWRQGQAVNEWREIANTAMNLLAPANDPRATTGIPSVIGPRGRMDAWCGLSIDTRSSKVWSAANGGHGDYFGNEVCTIDLLATAPAWQEWFAGSTGNVVNIDTTTVGPTHPSRARYLDGLPCSTHSYYGQQFLERQNRALRLGGSVAPLGSAYENVEGFDVSRPRGTQAWDAAGTYGMALGGTYGGWTPAIGWCCTKDPITERIYNVVQPRIWRFTPALSGIGGVWDSLGVLPDALNSGAMAATAVDTSRNRLFWLLGQGASEAHLCNLANGAWTARTLPVSAAADAMRTATGVSSTSGSQPHSSGMAYVPALDAYLVRQAATGGRVFRIDPETLAVTDLSTTGGASVPAGAPFGGEQGVYNRWLFVPQLKGMVYFPRASSNAWFLRTH